MNNVTHESEHGNTAVLNLGVSEKANCGFVTLAHEVKLSEVDCHNLVFQRS
jgi:hypothetical protein